MFEYSRVIADGEYGSVVDLLPNGNVSVELDNGKVMAEISPEILAPVG